nr:nuclear transport factor 2 family protein [Streptomyces tirandamycinicus]
MSGTEPVPAETYVAVQQFYARQMRLLDERRAGEWAETFAEDGVFVQNTAPEPLRGREAVAEAVRRNLARTADAPEQRRHVFSMLTVVPGPDGSLSTRCYAQVLVTPAGGPTRLHLSAVCEDELVPHGNGWLVGHRRVEHDGV